MKWDGMSMMVMGRWVMMDRRSYAPARGVGRVEMLVV